MLLQYRGQSGVLQFEHQAGVQRPYVGCALEIRNPQAELSQELSLLHWPVTFPARNVDHNLSRNREETAFRFPTVLADSLPRPPHTRTRMCHHTRKNPPA